MRNVIMKGTFPAIGNIPWRWTMCRLPVAALAVGLLFALGTAGAMAQTPTGSQSQSAPAGLNSNPAMSPTQPSGTVTKKKSIHHARRSMRHTTGTGSQSQSAPAGMDTNPAMRSR
jgi:hypothetical protein